MESIKRLPRSVHSSLRSSIILFDLPRVVEELIYNSMDAGAAEVFVYIGIRACYVKVEDDGCGITRDGLVILGERYATSKLQLLGDLETSSESLGFKGEALSSLSDVSLLEIRTKARGKPNAYCKILKGSKCLFLGIDDQREGVGTTVIARDLFYNQPVRRKYMQSSPKKVLHSVKKCVLRTALVHPQVSFKVTDIESEDELLCTVPSASPLPLVSDGFGKEVSSSLHEIAFSDQLLILCGYMSGPAIAFSTRAFQYLYVNSRFVSKGPIHNLINGLSASFHCLSQRQLEPEFHGDKRQKTQGYPAYMLNFCCPLSSYDLNFEPSKTIVEFKDWDTVLAFFERAVRDFWKQLPVQSLRGTPFTPGNCAHVKHEIQKEDTSKSSKMRKTKCNIQFHQDSPYHSSITSHLDMSSENISIYEKTEIPSTELQGFSSKLKPCQNKSFYFDQSEYTLKSLIHDSCDVFDSSHDQIGCGNSYSRQRTTDVDFLLPENLFFSNQTIKVREKYDMSPLVWKKSPTRKLKNESNHIETSDPYDILNSDQDLKYPFDCPSALTKPVIKGCSLMENVQDSNVYDQNHSALDVEFDHLGKDFSLHDVIDAPDGNYSSGSSNCRASFGFLRKCQRTRELDALSTDSVDPFSHDRASLTEENKLCTGLAAHVWEIESPVTGWFGSQHSLYMRSPKMGHDFIHGYTSRENLLSFNTAGCVHFGSKEENVEFSNPVQKYYNEDLPVMRCTKSKFSPKRNMNYDFPADGITCLEANTSGKVNNETNWLVPNSPNLKNIDTYPRSTFPISLQNHDKMVEIPWGEQELRNCQPSHIHKVRSRRSRSAPPFYIGKRKFSIINGHSTTIAGDTSTQPGNMCLLNGERQPCCISHPYLNPIVGEVSQTSLREHIDEETSTHELNSMKDERFDETHYNQLSPTIALRDDVTGELECGASTLTKWRTGIPQLADGNASQGYSEQKDDILNVSSGFLHLSGGSLVPESISRVCLEESRVLLQLDKKFIPVMAGETLVIIDQHAADERIRLEELRGKVLSGEGRRITYLDSEQELVLPEMGFQLLQKYSEQIQKWGWIFNSDLGSGSFAKNMKLLKRRTCSVTLIAVPCILDTNLTGKDLIEFIEQLVETDGSSSFPPCVIRILNYKACRGAIMFGDPLLPSECSLIVEELKTTSLCFQCAHGRPTTVPLLDMVALHERLGRLEMQSRGEEAEMWHGLRRHGPSLSRAQMRLHSAIKRSCDDG